MEQYSKVPLLFFFLAATFGLVLRWQFIFPHTFIPYSYLLHAHSHIMFLGWVFNALYFAFVYSYAKEKWMSRYQAIFILMQILNIGMSVSFTVQGYGVYSIVFSFLHTLLAVFFIIRFLQDAHTISSEYTISLTSIKISLFFFLISTIGPFSLGYIASNGLNQSKWYYFSVYYYLHFQYNGFFLFGVLGLFFKLLEDRNVTYSSLLAHRGIYLTAFACLPTYFLSTLWAKPSLIFNLIGCIGAIIQLVGFGILIQSCRKSITQIRKTFKPVSVLLLMMVTSSFLAKEMLQLLSAHSFIAQLAYEFRSYVIAYLHLVLLGVITAFLLIWYAESNFIESSWYKPVVLLYLIGFVGLEILLVAAPTLSALSFDPSLTQILLFSFSVLLWTGVGSMIFASMKKQTHSQLL